MSASPLTKLAVFSGLLALLFVGGALAGQLTDPAAPGGGDQGGHGVAAMAGEHASKAKPVRGLAVADNGLRLVVENPELRRGRTEQLRFRIVDSGGRTVRDFDVEHTKRMHMIVARRDLTGFQHLHPTMDRDGTWSIDLRLREAGSYRLLADFSYRKTASTLATDLRVDGNAALEPLPSPTPASKSNGSYDVRLDGDAVRAGGEAELRFTITRAGRPVQVDPYLGADGHLVALREGDLAFLHVHPEEAGHDDGVGFATTFPTTGRYRLFLQFKHEGRVQTVAFTQEVK